MTQTRRPFVTRVALPLSLASLVLLGPGCHVDVDDEDGLRSRGAIPDAMVIRDDLLAAAAQGANGGTLGHVLHMFWVETRTAAGYAHPMVGAENNKFGWGAEGQRIRVKESWTPPAACTGAGRIIARTLQRYGAYLGDNPGSGSGIKAQQGSTYPGLTQDALAPCVTWNDFEFLPPGWDG